MGRRVQRSFLLGVLAALALLGGAASSGIPSHDLRVMSFNIRYGAAPDGPNAWENRRGLLVETIRAFDPDLLATQECLATQAEFLRSALPEYGFVGAGRDDGRLAGEMCGIFYRKERFRLEDEGHLWLSETPGVAGSRGWDAALPRIASWIKLRLTADTLSTLCFGDTHFDHVGVQARAQSARLLCGRFAAAGESAPVVIGGDFNAPAEPDSAGPYRTLTRPGEAGAAAFVDSYRALHPAGPEENTYHGFSGTRSGPRVDWILASPDLQPVEASIVRTNREEHYPSDHFPVTAVLRMTATGGDGRR
jgi:endonuclease/exonuclease/phosphatase family metal-dependent hydrolase